MQAARHRSGAHPEGLADSAVGWLCRGINAPRPDAALLIQREFPADKQRFSASTGTCKTARRVRIASHYEFATDKPCGGEES